MVFPASGEHAGGDHITRLDRVIGIHSRYALAESPRPHRGGVVATTTIAETAQDLARSPILPASHNAGPSVHEIKATSPAGEMSSRTRLNARCTGDSGHSNATAMLGHGIG